MAANMWKNSLKNEESDNNKILYDTLLDFFYSETVLTFWISLVKSYFLHINKHLTIFFLFQRLNIYDFIYFNIFFIFFSMFHNNFYYHSSVSTLLCIQYTLVIHDNTIHTTESQIKTLKVR